MRSALVAIQLMPDGQVASPEVFEPLVCAAVGLGAYSRWNEAIPSDYQAHPGELRRALWMVHENYGLIQIQEHRAPGQVALALAKSRPASIVILHLGAEIDQVPGLGAVHRKGPGNSETLKIYLNDTPWLKLGDAPDDDVKYPVPNLVNERLPIVMEKLRSSLGSKATGLQEVLEAGLRDGNPEPSDIVRFFGFPKSVPLGSEEVVFLKKDSPLIRHSPSSITS